MSDAKKNQAETHDHTHAQNLFAVIPTPEKLNAHSKLTGKGVSIAFLDSGFYPHPDFADRIIKFHDISGEEKNFGKGLKPGAHHWHGTQTVTCCAGNGALSAGVYRGLASASELILVKVSAGGRISDENIEKGLRWVIENREKYNIRILNISLAGDADSPTRESKINQLAEELVKLGVVVTVAAGNTDRSCSIPPANAPSVITVGGFSDENRFSGNGFRLYHSNFGQTADGTVKPELIAPAMFVAAPILPETDFYESAQMLSILNASPRYSFPLLLDEYREKAGLPDEVKFYDHDAARRLIAEKLTEQKIVATHYQHVDGTSFAAPVTASVVAQMLEANPILTPVVVKNILISTATKLSHQPVVRQGFGMLNARLAAEEAARETHFLEQKNYSPPRVEGDRIKFFYHDDAASDVSLVGDFNGWKKDEIHFLRRFDGIWVAEIACLTTGKYRYKLLVDGQRWIEDSSHGFKEEDGFGGFNSILLIK